MILQQNVSLALQFLEGHGLLFQEYSESSHFVYILSKVRFVFNSLPHIPLMIEDYMNSIVVVQIVYQMSTILASFCFFSRKLNEIRDGANS